MREGQDYPLVHVVDGNTIHPASVAYHVLFHYASTTVDLIKHIQNRILILGDKIFHVYFFLFAGHRKCRFVGNAPKQPVSRSSLPRRPTACLGTTPRWLSSLAHQPEFSKAVSGAGVVAMVQIQGQSSSSVVSRFSARSHVMIQVINLHTRVRGVQS